MDTLTVSSSPATRHSLSGRFLRFVLSLSLLLLAAAQASAQYGGGGGMTGTLGTPGYVPASNGCGLGSDWHWRWCRCWRWRSLPGAPSPRHSLRLRTARRRWSASGRREKQKILCPRHECPLLKPGQRVEFKGQKSKAHSGAQTVAAKKLVKDLGSCDASTSAAQTQPAGN
jgi:hypothetical protein